MSSGFNTLIQVSLHSALVLVILFPILGGSVQTVKENAEALVVATKEIGLEVNADKTKFMVMARDQNAGRSHSMKIDNSSIEGWKSSNIWEPRKQFKMLFRQKLRAD
jgi:hypothetical protein